MIEPEAIPTQEGMTTEDFVRAICQSLKDRGAQGSVDIAVNEIMRTFEPEPAPTQLPEGPGWVQEEFDKAREQNASLPAWLRPRREPEGAVEGRPSDLCQWKFSPEHVECLIRRDLHDHISHGFVEPAGTSDSVRAEAEEAIAIGVPPSLYDELIERVTALVQRRVSEAEDALAASLGAEGYLEDLRDLR